ncbi:type II toxin-antitoxin system RelE/ParE family toxin [Brevundimonas sp.]|uniref:type II toxin-antitoxin system RelE/ParE family toxin n=1 Tax=Brevundimonas sp. TaxID=1871086 RepID=UPI003567409E
MRVAQWTQPARESYDAFLQHLLEQNKRRAILARNDLQDAVALLCRRPQVGRRSEWPGLKRWSVPEWDKIIIFREIPDGVRVVAFYDARQDLTVVDPTLNDF